MHIIENNDKLYQLVRTINKSVFKTKDDVKFYMEYIKCNHTLQHQDKYLFVRTIDDIEYIPVEEIEQTDNQEQIDNQEK